MDYIETKVVYKSSKTNFVNLPLNVVSMLYNANINSQDVICELVWSQNSRSPKSYAYCGWSGYSSASSLENGEYIELDPIFALSLQLKEHSKVTVNLKINNYNIAKTVELEPLTTADWELVELNAGVLENNLLYQTRCVAQDQVIVVYPSNTTNAKLKILNFDPTDIKGSKGEPLFAKIANDTEFHIKPKMVKREEPKRTRSRKTSSNRSRSGREKLPNLLLRGIALPHDLYDNALDNDLKYEIYVNTDECGSILQGGAKYAYVSIVEGPNLGDKPKNTQNGVTPDDSEEPSKAKKIVAKIVHFKESPESHVGLSRMLATALDVTGGVGNLVLLEPAMKPLSKKPDTIIIHPFITESEPSSNSKQINIKGEQDFDKKLKEKNELMEKATKLREVINLKGYFHDTSITNHSTIPIIDEAILPKGGLLEFAKIKEGWVESIDLTKIQLEIGTNVLNIIDSPVSSPSGKVVGQDKLILAMLKILKRCNSGVLLYGNSGSGKSVITNVVSQKLSGLGIHIEKIDCDSLALENLTSIFKKFDDSLKQISWFSPSVIILENCDLLVPAEQEHSDNSNSRQLSEYLLSKLLNYMKRRKIGLLCTAKNKTSLNNLLFNSHLIETDFNLRGPDKTLRRIIMQEFIDVLELKLEDNELLGSVSVETEGYLPGDLKILVDRAHYSIMSRAIENDNNDIAVGKLSKENFDDALRDFTPSSLRGVKLQKSTVKWEDIGGLRDAKSILLETLEWPTKYAPIFNNCPLRLRSGILLYGYPGCGKTLLASAVASQCGLNFISIKGPEILNKYIGASEQSVRELFDRAQLLKPCILFFDEFDSIAPKRGHDSTGVTDRVVNQMLTQMDGAEGLDGVYVLAATSRPDLIDSALLRPGRLDKSVICDIPDYEDRLDILECITAKMDLEKGVDIKIIAEQTEGYSGADLQAVGYNAYLLAVHEKLEFDEKKLVSESKQDIKNIEFFQLNNSKNFKASLKDMKPVERIELVKKLELIFTSEELSEEISTTSNDSMILIRHEHFIKSLEDTKSSISTKERLKLSSIYHQFLNPNEREGAMPDGMASNDIGGRTTLL